MTAPPGAGTRDRAAAFAANAIEWYDFAVFGALASALGVALFPPTGDADRLILVFAVFATSFLARPFGALLVGLRADRVGRRRVFGAMVVLMTVATALIGLVPSWSAVGIAAPALLVGLRMIQGFASGGEISTSIPFVLEAAPRERWGWYSGWHTATVALGIAAGIAVASVLTGVLSDSALESWGWRLGFLAALPLGVVGLRLRRLAVGDAVPAPVVSSAGVSLRLVWHEQRRLVCTGFALVSVLAATFNMWFLFLPAELASRDLHPLAACLGASMVGLVVAAGAAPWLGMLSDRIGTSTLLAWATAALGCLMVPLYLLASAGSLLVLVLADVAVGAGLGALVIGAYLAEALPTAVRATGIALSYGLATSLVGGTAPLVGSVLSRRGQPLGIPIYLSLLCAVACCAVLLHTDDYPRRVTQDPADQRHSDNHGHDDARAH
jgi:MHS family proline/betaine transporter-like MFS transporter